jgi:alpha-tubulin suppressor-like RCC1 family protein
VRGVWAALFALCACGRIGFDPSGSGAGNDAPPVGRWLGVNAAAFSACGIASDRSLWCWGLLRPAGIDPLQPPTQLSTASWRSISSWSIPSGFDHDCGILQDGSLWCAGNNYNGSLGDGTTNSSATPIPIGTATWREVAVGDSFTCGIQTDDTLWCWGYNASGQLGVGSTTQMTTPQQVAGSWTAIALGEAHACGIQSDGSLWCWGNNGWGTLGDGTTSNRDIPVQIAGTWLAVAASRNHTCAIATDSTAWCWGDNTYGQLGTGDSNNQKLSPTSTGMQLTALALGEQHTCGLLATGGLACWGQAMHGELGLATPGPVLTPTEIPGVIATQVSAAGGVTCIVDDQQRLACTGRNSTGQLAVTPGERHAPTQIGTGTDWTGITAGGTHACGTKSSGETMCWGLNNEGEVGDGSFVDRQQPVVAAGGTTFASVVAGLHTTIGVKADTTAWLFGCDWVAQTNNSSAEQLAMTGWISAAIGDQHTCTLGGAGALYCRGDNAYGQLGDGTMTASPNVQVAGTWRAVAAGLDTTCGINTSGTAALECWGAAENGEVGNGMAIGGAYPTPQTVAITVTAASRVAVGNQFACAIDAAGKLWCWGINSCGQLTGAGGSSSMPAQIGTRTDWREVTAGADHVCAIPNDGTLWCWGRAGNGQTADLTAVIQQGDTRMPLQVGTETTWAHVAAGTDFTCALKTDGTLWCFGGDYDGQLGMDGAWHAEFVYVP